MRIPIVVLALGGWIVSASAADFSLANGTYKAVFPQGVGCGTMVISGGATKKINYSAGPCGDTPNFHSAGSFDGEIIYIKAATFKLSSATAGALKGRWKLGNYSATVTFKK